MIDQAKIDALSQTIASFGLTLKTLLNSAVKTRSFQANDIMGLASDGTLVGVQSMNCDYSFAVTPADLPFAKGQTENFRHVFNNWKRLSIGSDGTPNSVEADLAGWVYQHATSRIKSTIAPARISGFVAPVNDTHDYGFEGDYVFETTLRSEVAGNKGVGVILAYTEDATGKAQTLSLIRHLGGIAGAPKLGLYLNAVDPAALPTPLAGSNTQLLDADWAGGVVRLRVVRSGTTLTISTSNPGTAYVPAADVVYNLTGLSGQNAWVAPNRRFGYISVGQDGVSWDVVQKRTSGQMIMDYTASKVWQLSAGIWTAVAGKTPDDYVRPNQLYFSQSTNQIVYIDKTKQIHVVK